MSSWSLADARDEAARLRLQIKRDGLDPVQERQQTRRNPIKTLDDLYADYYEKRKLEIASHLKERSQFLSSMQGNDGPYRTFHSEITGLTS